MKQLLNQLMGKGLINGHAYIMINQTDVALIKIVVNHIVLHPTIAQDINAVIKTK